MQHATHTDFAESLAHLRQALADADPLTARVDGAVTDNAERAAALFTGASDYERTRLLLRALDDAIATIEIASHLADELHARLHDVGAESAASEHLTDDRASLYTAYLAFAESQTQYQALYQYRNVLAAQLNEKAQAAPVRVGATAPETEPTDNSPSHAAKPRRRRKKSD
ncbi:MAG: hypothetical protein ACRDHE_10305 [Ktedonobacterales bacterium]